MRTSYALVPLFLRVRLRRWLPAGIWPVTCQNPDVLVKHFEQFQKGNTRLILAFRHSQVDDPLCLAYLFARILPRTARQQGGFLPQPIHTYFMYDRGMPLWAGRWLGWFFSRMGGIPVHRGRRLDLTALKTVREYLLEGQFPMTIAPEGATNGHGEIVSPLEPGAAQLAFWTVEALQKMDRSEQVLIVPVGLRYFYPHPDWQALDRLLTRLEMDAGLSPHTEDYYQRLLRLGQYLLTRMEQFYGRYYSGHFTNSQAWNEAPEALGQRLSQVLEVALEVGENFFGLPSNGSIISRCRRLEEAGWSYIYREDIQALRQLPPLEQGLANWLAEEANLHMRHMRLVESFVAVSGHYVQEQPTFERFAETTLILFDLMERLRGVNIPQRPQLGRRHGVITVGEAINVSQRWSDYAPSRRAAKGAIATLTKDLQKSLESLL